MSSDYDITSRRSEYATKAEREACAAREKSSGVVGFWGALWRIFALPFLAVFSALLFDIFFELIAIFFYWLGGKAFIFILIFFTGLFFVAGALIGAGVEFVAEKLAKVLKTKFFWGYFSAWFFVFLLYCAVSQAYHAIDEMPADVWWWKIVLVLEICGMLASGYFLLNKSKEFVKNLSTKKL